ncbi:DUF4381 domain-containing protein [Gammaproteobacteria bacterium]|nr:DUF4381 domain-containing protein [Gammaproteobacteria bacterium]
MESQDLLAALADIHLPAATSFWPPAIGWWIVAVLLLFTSAYLIRNYINFIMRRRRINLTLQELQQLYNQFQEKSVNRKMYNQAGLTYLQGVNSLLTRVALLLYPQTDKDKVNDKGRGIAELSGQAWLNFLDRCDNSTEFRAGAGKALGEGIYQREFNADADALYELARQWIIKRYQEKSRHIKTAAQQKSSKVLPGANS